MADRIHRIILESIGKEEVLALTEAERQERQVLQGLVQQLNAGSIGHAASHGCLRMSGSNILELGEKYAEAGTDITINRDRNNPQACTHQGSTGTGVTWIFHPYRLTWIKQGVSAEVQGLLGPSDNEHLLRFAFHTARLAHELANGSPERSISQ